MKRRNATDYDDTGPGTSLELRNGGGENDQHKIVQQCSGCLLENWQNISGDTYNKHCQKWNAELYFNF